MEQNPFKKIKIQLNNLIQYNLKTLAFNHLSKKRLFLFIFKIIMLFLFYLKVKKLLKSVIGEIQLSVISISFIMMEQNLKENLEEFLIVNTIQIMVKMQLNNYMPKFLTMLGELSILMKLVIFQLLMLGEIVQLRQLGFNLNPDSQFQEAGNQTLIWATTCPPRNICIKILLLDNLF